MYPKKYVAIVIAFISFFQLRADPPELLSETHLYEDIKSRTIQSENKPFSPQYPLWSDCAEKLRWIYLPEGKKIDTTDMDRWIFPVGTILWKEFSFNHKPVETRMVMKTRDTASWTSWEFATYRWREDGTDADLVSPVGIKNAAPTGCGSLHDIPGRPDCIACHKRGGDPVLGFDALQLSTDRDPNAPHQEPVTTEMLNLEKLVKLGKLSNNPRHTDNKIHASSPEGRAAMGYLHGNCGSCHNSHRSSAAVNTGLFLRHSVAAKTEEEEPAFNTTVNHLTRLFRVPGCQLFINSYDIHGGKPEASAIFVRMSAVESKVMMPPVGRKIVDYAATDLVRSWITGLQPPQVLCN